MKCDIQKRNSRICLQERALPAQLPHVAACHALSDFVLSFSLLPGPNARPCCSCLTNAYICIVLSFSLPFAPGAWWEVANGKDLPPLQPYGDMAGDAAVEVSLGRLQGGCRGLQGGCRSVAWRWQVAAWGHYDAVAGMQQWR